MVVCKGTAYRGKLGNVYQKPITLPEICCSYKIRKHFKSDWILKHFNFILSVVLIDNILLLDNFVCYIIGAICT